MLTSCKHASKVLLRFLSGVGICSENRKHSLMGTQDLPGERTIYKLKEEQMLFTSTLKRINK